MWRIGAFLKKSREKTLAFLERIPRKTQVCINLLLILVLPFWLYIFIGSPTLSVEQSYRRAEKANLVGPATILGIEEIDSTFGNVCVIADAGESAILYTVPKSGRRILDTLVYRKKVGKVSVFGVPVYEKRILDGRYTLFIMDEYPEAVRAELDLELCWTEGETLAVHTNEYSLSAERKKPGYFRLDIHYENENVLDASAEENAIEQFANWSWRPPTFLSEPLPTATVRLYDHANNLICVTAVDLFPEASS